MHMGRWSRIAQHLPGRTDNEIKNYWRTRVQKQARQLRVDANSAVFRDAVRCYWMPRLLEKMAATSAHQVDPAALLHPAHIAAGVGGSASPPVHGGQHDATSAPGPGSGYGHHQSYPVDPSPSTSTSGCSGSTPAAALPPVPCFSELSWVVDQYGPYADLDGAGAFDSSALGSLGLDGLDLGPADGDVYPDSSLLDYLNSACTGGGAMVTMMGGGGNAALSSCGGAIMGGHDGDYGPPSSWRTDELCQAAARKLGGDHHQWGGGI